MNLKKVSLGLISSVILSSVGLPLMEVSANEDINVETASNNQVKSSEALDGNNAITLGDTIYSISPEATNQINNQFSSILKAAKYKEGVTKVKASGKYTIIYISKADAKDIVSGVGIIVGGYTGKAVGVLLSLAGLGTTRAIKGGIWIKTMNVKDFNGVTHTVVHSYGWQ